MYVNQPYFTIFLSFEFFLADRIISDSDCHTSYGLYITTRYGCLDLKNMYTTN